MTYGALSAKIRALYGKRLRADDFARLAGLKNEAELLEALRQHPGWSRALSLVPPGAWSYVGRVEMEGALRDELRLEYRSLSYYVPREDKPLMQFQLRAAERSALLAALRRLKTGRYAKEPPPTSAVPLRLRLDEGALASCTSYDQLLDAARDTIYAPVLRHLRPSRDGALPDFTLAEAALRTAYFSHLYRIVHRQYTGRTQKVLLRALGEQIDLLNIIHVLRLKTYFPQTEPETYLRVLSTLKGECFLTPSPIPCGIVGYSHTPPLRTYVRLGEKARRAGRLKQRWSDVLKDFYSPPCRVP